MDLRAALVAAAAEISANRGQQQQQQQQQEQYPQHGGGVAPQFAPAPAAAASLREAGRGQSLLEKFEGNLVLEGDDNGRGEGGIGGSGMMRGTEEEEYGGFGEGSGQSASMRLLERRRREREERLLEEAALATMRKRSVGDSGAKRALAERTAVVVGAGNVLLAQATSTATSTSTTTNAAAAAGASTARSRGHGSRKQNRRQRSKQSAGNAYQERLAGKVRRVTGRARRLAQLDADMY